MCKISSLNIKFVTLALCLAILPCCGNSFSEKDAALRSLIDFHQAVSSSNYKTAYAKIDSNSRLALSDLAESYDARRPSDDYSVWQKYLLARIRSRSPQGVQASKLSALEIFEAAVLNEGVRSDDLKQWNVELDGKKSAKVFSVHAPEAYAKLNFENNEWKVDLVHTMTLIEEFIGQFSQAEGISEDEAIEYLTSGGRTK